jgi:ABC-type uncharacterized transport system involved in gliding motility auxiliary subunit
VSNQPQKRLGAVALVLLALGFIAAVTINNSLFRGARLDLTEHQLYTLSAGTRNILGSIEEPINFYFFFSDEATADIPGLRTYAVRVREVLEEFAAASDGKLVVSEVDPLPFSEDEDRADQYGLQRIAFGGLGDGIYLGLAATNSVGDQETVPFFQPDRESFLEYDLAKLVSTLTDPDKIIVGLLTAVPMTVGFDPQTQTMREPWVVVGQTQQLFELRSLEPNISRIAEDVDILWIVHPKALGEATLYAIDQFILSGGKTLIFVDPLAEIEAAQAPPGDPSATLAAQGSNLASLFAAWGVEFSTSEVVADERYALTVGGGSSGQRPIQHLGLIGLDSAAMNSSDVTTANLSSVNFGTSGFFTVNEGAPARMEALVTSSTQAAPLPVDSFRFLQNPESLRDGFTPTGTTYTLAARVSGLLPSAFPDGAPAPPEDQNGELPANHRPAAETDVNVVVVGDVDVLSDRLWVQVQNFFGRRISTPFANNGDLVINLLDNLSGSADLIGIRSRATSNRPFTVVDELRREADAEFRSTEQRLQAELQETETRLTELQSARQDDANSLMLSAEQQSEIDRFVEQRTRIRKELRSVQRNLDQDIEDLGTQLKFINIWLVPLLVIGLAPLLARRRRWS